LVATGGVKDLVIVATKGSVLVAGKDCSQGIENVAERLKAGSRKEWDEHREVFRPWGKYEAIDKGCGCQVKRLTVKPGAKLSLQKHQHRA